MFSSLSAAAGDSDAAINTWNDPDGAQDPATDIANAIGNILDAEYINTTDIANIGIFYPVKLFTHLVKPIEVNNIIMSLRQWTEREYNIKFYPTKQLTDDALVVLKSPETALHMKYTGSAIPRAFIEQTTEGEEYTFKDYFKTVIVPETDGGSTTNRIRKITNAVE